MATPSSSAGRSAKTAAVVAAYLVVTAIMTWPYVSYTHFATALYRGDAELIIWALAWDNHAVLDGVRLFSSNLFFPAPDTLRYNEHLFGLSLFTLPWRAAGASPVLAHNALWWTAFLLNGLAAFAWLRRFVTTDLAAFVGSLVFAYSFYVMLHAHAHLHLIWVWGLPASLLLFAGGPPAPFQVPAIYRTPEVQQARALLSLPEYREAAEWYLGGDYLYYATAHWRPIVNGFGRSEPPGHADLVSIARRFPASAAELRELGVHYVVLHAGRYPDGARDLLAAARVDPACRVALRIGDDYLIELVAAPRP